MGFSSIKINVAIQQKGDLNTIENSFKVPKPLNLYPKGARDDLLEQIKTLGLKPEPISFTQRDLTRLLKGLKCIWIQRASVKNDLRIFRMITPWPELPLGELFIRAKALKKLVFLDADRKVLKVFATCNSGYYLTFYPLLKQYFQLNKNLNVFYNYKKIKFDFYFEVDVFH